MNMILNLFWESYFWENLFDKAKKHFDDIIRNNSGFELINETKYYYSFILYKEGNYQESRNILEELLKKKAILKMIPYIS